MTRPRRNDKLERWLVEALNSLGGQGTIVEICRAVWSSHESELRSTETLFFTWQYQVRWLATELRKDGVIRPAKVSPRGVWQLK